MRVKLIGALAAVALGLATYASGSASAAPPPDVFNDTDNDAWLCFGEPEAPVPPNHCINAKSQGNTGNIKVLEPDTRGPQEGISFDPKADDRPCPHDDFDGDRTWWTPPEQEGFWVCHHKPPTPPGRG